MSQCESPLGAGVRFAFVCSGLHRCVFVDCGSSVQEALHQTLIADNPNGEGLMQQSVFSGLRGHALKVGSVTDGRFQFLLCDFVSCANTFTGPGISVEFCRFSGPMETATNLGNNAQDQALTTANFGVIECRASDTESEEDLGEDFSDGDISIDRSLFPVAPTGEAPLEALPEDAGMGLLGLWI
jgi:hypothetical protein